MEGRGRSRRRSLRREWKRRLSSVLAVVLTAVMILNMPLSIDGLGLHVSDAFASGSNADQEDSVWATASNAKYRQGDSQDVDIYVIANDSGAVPGNTTSMTLYLKNNTDQAISEGVLTFSGKYINKEDASFQDVGSGEEYSQIITAGGPGYSAEESGEGLIYQETDKTALLADETAADVSVTETEAEAEQLPVLPEDPGDGEAEEEESEEAYKLENIDLQPGELHEVYFEFYTEDDVKSTKANVSFSFRGENEEGSRVTGDTKFYYSIGLPNVNFSMEDGMQIESGVKNDLEIWMSEPDWVDEDLEERLQEQEEKKAQEEMEQAEEEAEEDGNTGNTASGSDASRATDSNASKDNTASNSNAAKDDTSDGALSKEDAEKIDKYTEEAMEISESRVSYTVEIFGAKYSDFHPRKTEEAEDIGWISCVYEVDRETEPGIYYGKVTATGKWNKKDFTTEQGFLFEVTGEGQEVYEFEQELQNVIVRAVAERGVLPKDAELQVKELKENDAETSAQLREAKEALKAEGVEYDGMLALDISFVDKNGEEVEPEGEVQVSIEMKAGVLSDAVQKDTLMIHHVKEYDEGNVDAEAVADAGTIERGSNEEKVIARFSVDSFSPFIATWNYAAVNVTIADSIKEDGWITAQVNGVNAGDQYKYVWERSETGLSDWEEVTREKVTGELYNMSENGSQVNPVLDYAKIKTDAAEAGTEIPRGKRYYYRVTICDNATGSSIGQSSVYQVPYYDALQNGSFESPEVENYGDYQPYYNSGASNVIWKTTAEDGKIEYINADPEKKTENSWWADTYQDLSIEHHKVEAAEDGEQYAELNANMPGALYQDVITVPGSELHWQLYHRARGTGYRSGEVDTMYLLIMPTNIAEENDITTQEKVEEVLRNPEYYSAYVEEITNNNISWHKVEGLYTVENEQQYLTRFFFVAGNTAYDDAWGSDPSLKGTVGNHLDNVWFSEEVPPPDPGKANLTVRKTVSGLLPEDMDEYRVKISLKQGGTLIKEVELEDFSSGSDTAEFNDIDPGTYQITETVVGPDGLAEFYTEPDVTYGGATNNGTLTVEGDKEYSVTITNAYTPKEYEISIDKVVSGNMSNEKDVFDFTYQINQNVPVPFELTAESSPKKIKVSYGDTIIVTETDAGGYTNTSCDVSDGIGPANWDPSSRSCTITGIKNNGIIEFTNTKTVDTPTGVFNDNYPYLLMLAIAAVGTTAFIYPVCRRKKQKANK